MTILQGEITFLGAAISASDTAHPIYAPSCHALPVIRCLGTEVGYAEIVLRQHKSGLEHLDTLSPLFAKIWNDGKCLFGSKFDSLLKQKRSSTYQIVCTPSILLALRLIML
jgi:polynucleotide 5'-hydroxyl-kinase GRC3/NOL9